MNEFLQNADEKNWVSDQTFGSAVGRGGGGVTGGGGGGKKKKGKGNRKTRPAFVPKSSEDNLEFDDEVARSVREVDKILGTTPTAATGNNMLSMNNLKGTNFA